MTPVGAACLAGSRGGPPLVLQDRPAPGPPQEDQLLVQVAASSVNGTDLGMLGGGLPSVAFAAAGGIGSFAVLLASLYGATTTALASGDRQDYLMGLGADEVVTGHAQDLLGSGERWDVLLDCPAALSFDEARPLLADDGVMVSTQAISTDVVRGALRAGLHVDGPAFTSVRTRVGNDLAHLVRLLDEGRLRVPLDRTFRLEEVHAAHAYARSSEVTGKVVLTV